MHRPQILADTTAKALPIELTINILGDNHGHHSSDHLDSSAHRCTAHLALQLRLGLLSYRRFRSDLVDCFGSCSLQAHLAAADMASPDLSKNQNHLRSSQFGPLDHCAGLSPAGDDPSANA